MIYVDANSALTERLVWPLSVVFLDDAQVLLAWCCLRQDFRKFVLTRIRAVSRATESFRPRRVALLREMIEGMLGG